MNELTCCQCPVGVSTHRFIQILLSTFLFSLVFYLMTSVSDIISVTTDIS